MAAFSEQAVAEPASPAVCTLVLPTYNASAFIDRTVDRLAEFLQTHPDFLVLFVCDGCTDDTVERLERLRPRLGPRADVLAYTRNRGKGFALRTGLSRCTTPYRIFTDVDLAYDPNDAPQLLRELQDGADLVVVNRASPQSTFLISPRDFSNIYKRHLMSRAYNAWLRLMLPITILDTQAGFKGMTARAWDALSPHLTADGFFFDTELLAVAGRLGMDVREVPAHFRYLDPTTVKMVRAGWNMFWETLHLRRRLKSIPAAHPAAADVELPAPVT
ncbi:MAG: glycosyltransferase [Tepidisphaerales bacterium]